jgi:hypothetical protein
MTMKFTTSECVKLMKHCRTVMALNDGVTVMHAYEMVEAVVNRRYPGRPPGTRVNDRNEVVPITSPREPVPTRRLATTDTDTNIEDDETTLSPDDPTELVTGMAPIFTDDSEVGIVPELEPDPEPKFEDDTDGDSEDEDSCEA